jgi:DNA repair exonuclease SbcCD ATPase subunit
VLPVAVAGLALLVYSIVAGLVRLSNFIKRLAADEERVEQLISVCLARDAQKIIEVVEKIRHIDTDVPLEQLEENIRQTQAELLRLQQQISEALATIESVNDDRQAIQEYKELKGEMNNLQLKDPKKISNVFRSFKIYGCEKNHRSICRYHKSKKT